MTEGQPVMVHMRHVRQAKLCSSGMRAWASLHGFDAVDFIKNGIEAEKLEATGDYFGIMVAKFAREEAAK